MTWNDHDHRGEYAQAGHSHYGEYAEERHRHHDLERDDEAAQQAITCLREEVAGLRRRLDDALERIGALEKQTPQARQLQLEADQAAADLAESGYDRHGRGCQCSYCYVDPEEEGDQVGEAGFPVVPAGQIDAEVAADLRRLTGKDSS